MSVTAPELATQRDRAMDAHALNRAQAALLFDPSPECDSLAEYIVALRRYQVPEWIVTEMLHLTRELITSNDLEGEVERLAAGDLERLAAAARAPRRQPRATVKQLAALVREHDDAGTLPELVACTPDGRLTQRSLLHELGKARAARLMECVGAARSAVAS